jgi:hypothetical protein
MHKIPAALGLLLIKASSPKDFPWPSVITWMKAGTSGSELPEFESLSLP